ncbi:hypothetical protein TWF694_007994 [Orbilia ellipsospora]|uniref:Terpene synthase n=1 Tax=Orbilia ellipsospora TaxID=2528407 RepID=A0AAV9XHG7_9PEZI
MTAVAPVSFNQTNTTLGEWDLQVEIIEPLELKEEETVAIQLPNLYQSICLAPRHVNPLLHLTKDTDDWITEKLRLGKAADEFKKVEIPFLCAVILPDGPEQPLRALTEWMSYVVFFDDRVDKGGFTNDPGAAAEEIIAFLAVLDDDYPDIPVEANNGLIRAYQQVWKRISKYGSRDDKIRFKRAERYYMTGLLRQIKLLGSGTQVITPDQYLPIRRRTSGMYTTLAFVEWSVNSVWKLPAHIIEHPSIVAFRKLTNEIVSLSNDILSFPKDLSVGESTNMVVVLMKQGYEIQEAIDNVSEMVFARYKEWEQKLRDLPKWGEEIDIGVAKLIQGYSDVLWGDLEWSFTTARYFGKSKNEVKATGKFSVPKRLEQELRAMVVK